MHGINDIQLQQDPKPNAQATYFYDFLPSRLC